MKQTVMTTNGGHDTILLVDSNDRVLSAWMATKQEVINYVNDTDASQWEAGQFAGFADPTGEENEDELRTIAAYGEEGWPRRSDHRRAPRVLRPRCSRSHLSSAAPILR